MESTHTEPRGNYGTALDHAAKLLRTNPALAERQATEILKVFPGAEPARRILASACRMQGRPQESLAILEPLFARHSASPGFQYEWGRTLGSLGRTREAIGALRDAVRLDPEYAGAWRALGDLLVLDGDEAGGRDAHERHFALTAGAPQLVEAVDLMRAGKIGQAERSVREYLKSHPADVNAIRLLADIGMKLSRYDDARNLLARCLELAPDFHLARYNYAVVLTRQNRLPAALAEVRRLLAHDPANPSYLLLESNVRVQMGDHEQALEILERVLAVQPDQPRAQMNYGHTLKTVGRLDEAIAAYRRCIALRPEIGEAYWNLANLKTYRFTDAEIALMRERLAATEGDAEDQSHLAFALGKALEDRGEFDESFRCYERGNRIRKVRHRHSARINVFDTARQMKTLTAEFFAARQGWGCPVPDPIFIVGLPRSGSTLLEQILSSHPQVQGTAELIDVIQISRRLGEKSRRLPASRYPEVLATLEASRFRELGEGYVASTRVQRDDRPYFIDKMPNNFRHVGLIHLMLPNAKIIDARRHPMACCFSGFKQLFASGQTFSYGLEEIGKYYRDYVFLMDHWDRVLPGRVLRVEYEDMVADTGSQVRRLLDYCGLTFDDRCLRFWETERAVRTPSSEQVRQPIYHSGLEQWRRFEKHLGPLKEALGPVLERYPIGS
jgi:tetratricopeptide (TPR) repeat protein